MEKTMKRTNLPPLAFVLLGLTLVFVSYLLADGQDRLMPFYGFPEPAYGCNLDNVGLTTTPPPELSRNYHDYELLRCYPQQNYPYYALAVLGSIITCWALVISVKQKSLSGINTFIVSFAMTFTGGRLFKLELDLVGGSHPEPLDIFDSVAFLLVIAGLLVGIFGIVTTVAVGRATK